MRFTRSWPLSENRGGTITSELLTATSSQGEATYILKFKLKLYWQDDSFSHSDNICPPPYIMVAKVLCWKKIRHGEKIVSIVQGKVREGYLYMPQSGMNAFRA